MFHATDNALSQEAFNGLEIRSGSSEHIEAMALLTERANAERAELVLPNVLPEDSEDHKDLIERQHYAGYWSFLAFDNERLAAFTAGYLGTWKGESDDSNSEYLWLLMVDPDYYRRGLGRALLRLANEAAFEDGASRVTLYTTVDNERAINLYESEGYRQVDTVASPTRGVLKKDVLYALESV